jgi:elongation factor Ts
VGVQLNCETDFVARNTEFQDFARAVTAQTLDSNPGLSIDVANLLARPFGSSDITVKDSLAELISKIRENIVISRAAVLEVPSGVIGR